ncbi:MAG: hypothetical protein BWK76_04655 [Desulfobulbaceae bacterium A2]|nr:MAG: hypothetical protein BWK76_04655 [Desulfobulbaceae bacterium A2]
MDIQNLFHHWTYRIFAPGALVREQYEAFRTVLAADTKAHDLMAELEEIVAHGRRMDMAATAELCRELSEAVERMVEGLTRIAPLENLSLREVFRKINFYLNLRLAPPEYPFSPPYTVFLHEPLANEQALTGGKAAQLADLVSRMGAPVPRGFVITTRAFYYFLEDNDLKERLLQGLRRLDLNSYAALEAVSRDIVQCIRAAPVPPEIQEAIEQCREALWSDEDASLQVSVRSSAVGEDGELSFAGQFSSVLDVSPDHILDAYREVISSKYTPSALFYRVHHGLFDLDLPMAVLVQEMIAGRTSGVLYTRDPGGRDDGTMTVHAVIGAGEFLVSGTSNAALYILGRDPEPRILARPSNHEELLNDAQLNELADWGVRIETARTGPQDIEWCQSGDGRLHLLQARPLVTSPPPDPRDEVSNGLAPGYEVLLQGCECASPGLGAGPVFVLERDADLASVPDGAVLVSRYGRPHYAALLGHLAGLVTERGSRAGHLASIAREFRLPFLVRAEEATTLLQPGRMVTVDARMGRVLAGDVAPHGMPSSSPGQDDFDRSPFMRSMRQVMTQISPLRMLDPDAPEFQPESCRSLHDLIRYIHEQAVRAMFSLSTSKGRIGRGSKKILSSLPIQLYLLDVGGAVPPDCEAASELPAERLCSRPLAAIWQGLNDPGLSWSGPQHFDWGDFSSIVDGGGLLSPDAPSLASYAVASGEYCNVNIRFGYHFTVVEALCGELAQVNYCNFRFTGGGGRAEGKALRLLFLQGVLEGLGFLVSCKGDLLDARLKDVECAEMHPRLVALGRLLGVTRLMDMRLHDMTQISALVADFLAERPLDIAPKA